MKLQYLGGSRDAFKWDLLHWLCTRSSIPFSQLVVVPLLTPDIVDSNEGKTPQHWFKCQDFIRPFLGSLSETPRTLSRISTLGELDPAINLNVTVFGSDRHVPCGAQRSDYWVGFCPEYFENAVVFYDPDNGFETKTQHGPKWIRHAELANLFNHLPQNSIAVVYQHRPRRKWSDLFTELETELNYVTTAIAVFESNLAFIALASDAMSGRRVIEAMTEYAKAHPVVKVEILKNKIAVNDLVEITT